MKIPLLDFRDYQLEAAAALDDPKINRVVLCWGRRNGKTLFTWNYAVKRALEEPMGVVFVYPEKETGKRDIWNAFDNDGLKFIDYVPDKLCKKKNKTEMTIELINGSMISIVGAKDPNRLRGANNKLYIFDEFVDTPSEALNVVEPVIMGNGGTIVLISTPKITGKSGYLFKQEFDLATKMDRRFSSLRTAEGVMTAEALEEARISCIEKYGNDNWYRQEYLCDWGSIDSGSYYGDKIKQIEARNQVRTFKPLDKYPVHVALDLGMSDAMAFIFFQYANKQIRVVDYGENTDLSLKTLNNMLREKKYDYGTIFFPHDGNVRELSDSTTRIDKFRDMGWDCELLARESREVGIERVMDMLSYTHFNEVPTSGLIHKLKLYSRKYNDTTLEYLGPDHNTTSHAADVFRYMCSAINYIKEGFSAFAKSAINRKPLTTRPDENKPWYEEQENSTRPSDDSYFWA